jgi:hypothetical protein
MTRENIIKDLKKRQKALQKQVIDIETDDESEDDVFEYNTEVNAKLSLIEELLEKYSK